MTISDLEFSIRSAEAARGPASQFDFSCFIPRPSQGHAGINNLQAETCLRVGFSGNSAHNRDVQVYSLEIVLFTRLSIIVPSLNKKILEDRSYQMVMIPADLFAALSPSIAING